MKYLSLSDTTKILLPQGESKILVKMQDELPRSFEIFKEGSPPPTCHVSKVMYHMSHVIFIYFFLQRG